MKICGMIFSILIRFYWNYKLIHRIKDLVEIGSGYGTFTIPTSRQLESTEACPIFTMIDCV